MNGLRRATDEQGSTLPLILVYTAIGLVLIVIVAAATSLYVERKRLYTLADATALASAESAALATLDPGVENHLDDNEVRLAAQAFLSERPSARFAQLMLENAGTRDGRTATITLSARWQPPLLGPMLPEGVRLEVTSSARSTFW